MNTLPCPFTP